MKQLKCAALALALSLLNISVAYANNETSATSQQVMPATININTADVNQLAKLPGIGKKKAQAIVDYRQAHGEFSSLSDLTMVKGIGTKLIAKLEGKVSL
ncbi:ComEA family DNA-binding protein [Pseudoalteromonas sp.]|uniref:ComEA family DNA-binding protein n=1 Tax=Pseudoalteromonas sp. TaxID=53249 RepID=UPI0035626FA3